MKDASIDDEVELGTERPAGERPEIGALERAHARVLAQRVSASCP